MILSHGGNEEAMQKKSNFLPIRKRTHARPNKVIRVAYKVIKNPSAINENLISKNCRSTVRKRMTLRTMEYN